MYAPVPPLALTVADPVLDEVQEGSTPVIDVIVNKGGLLMSIISV